MTIPKTRVLIEYNRSAKPVFQFTKKNIDDLLARNADLADSLHFSVINYENNDLTQWTEQDKKEFYDHLVQADVLVGYQFPTRDLRERAPKLRWIHFISSGVEHKTPFDWVPDGVSIINNRGVHLPKSGESFATFLRMLSAGVPRLLTAQREIRWDRLFTTVIKGKTLVVLGMGNQGSEMARQAKNMGLKVIGIDPYRTSCEYCDEMVGLNGMKDAFARADFLGITAPSTPESYRIINAEKIGWLPRHAGLLNVSRGTLVDEAALDEALRKGDLSGAILDVFEVEPLPKDSPLWNTPNLVIIPHVSSDDLDNYIPLTLDLTVANIRNEMAGRPLKNLVDTGKGF